MKRIIKLRLTAEEDEALKKVQFLTKRKTAAAALRDIINIYPRLVDALAAQKNELILYKKEDKLREELAKELILSLGKITSSKK